MVSSVAIDGRSQVGDKQFGAENFDAHQLVLAAHSPVRHAGGTAAGHTLARVNAIGRTVVRPTVSSLSGI